MIIADIIKVSLPAVVSFVIGICITPLLTHYLYKHEMWKKKAGKVDLSGNNTPIFNELHKEKEVNTPRLGGTIIWFSTVLTALLVWVIAYIFGNELSVKLDFVSRNQTWLPLLALFLGGVFGFIDDILEIRGTGDHKAGGLSLKKRLFIVFSIGLASGYWFYAKLGIMSIGLFGGLELPLGILFIPFFAIVCIAIYSGGVIDGIDGLAGGIFATMFSAYGVIAFYQQQIDLAALCLSIVGAILAFLWFNIPPARFYMSETGTMGLTIALAVVAFMTDTLGGGYGVIVLPIIALPLVITTLSVIIQVLSKKIRGKKVFLVAPVHHHFEALGWPAYKVTMRYWIIGVIFAILGVILALV